MNTDQTSKQSDQTVSKQSDLGLYCLKYIDSQKNIKYYNKGKRLGQIYHAGLRTSCSPLRQHLHQNIVESPHCTCGDIIDTHHYLFVCHQFTDLRRDLINSVSDISKPNFNVLLCGGISLTFGQNKQIFKAVHEYIIKSKHFEYIH